MHSKLDIVIYHDKMSFLLSEIAIEDKEIIKMPRKGTEKGSKYDPNYPKYLKE